MVGGSHGEGKGRTYTTEQAGRQAKPSVTMERGNDGQARRDEDTDASAEGVGYESTACPDSQRYHGADAAAGGASV